MNSPKKKSYERRTTNDERRKIYRIIDANLNRSREGLRVCEDIVRFVFNDARLRKDLRELRHSITKTAKSLPLSPKQLLTARDIRFDVGKNSAGNGRRDYADVFTANIRRAEEALRVLEEFSHILDKGTGDNFQKVRFQLYNLEKKIIAGFPGLSNIG